MALAGSYIDATEADAYAAKELDATVWTALTTAQKEAVLRQATDEIDSLRYQGRKYESDQERAFPRSHSLRPGEGAAVAGGTWDWDEGTNAAVVPEQVLKACFLQAASIAAGNRADRLDDRHDGVASQSAGGLSESYGGAMPALCRRAHLLMRTYYLRTGRIV